MNEKPTINAEQFFADLDALNAYGRQPDGAIHRVAYSPADQAGRAWLRTRLQENGLTPVVDPAGNTLAVYPGLEPRPPIAIGSHTDTVPYGGEFDGALGVVAALAVVEAVVTAGRRLRHPFQLINFAAEEATMAGGTTGSQALTGLFDPALLDKAAWDGRPVREHMVQAGLDPSKIKDAQQPVGRFAAFVELHIEQSRRLEEAGLPIAIVDGFVAIRRYAVRFSGQANHAGTTPMSERRDALVAAAPIIHFVRDVAEELGIVATIGDFSVYPGAPNVIPERVELIVEMRGLHAAVLDRALALISEETVRLGGRLDPVVDKPAVQTDPVVQEAIRRGCQTLGLETMIISSGAGHDAMNMARICPQGMFFVPSRAGISHSKEEFSSPEDCLNGARLLLESVLNLDILLE